jgi:hypothetical protein
MPTQQGKAGKAKGRRDEGAAASKFFLLQTTELKVRTKAQDTRD